MVPNGPDRFLSSGGSLMVGFEPSGACLLMPMGIGPMYVHGSVGRPCWRVHRDDVRLCTLTYIQPAMNCVHD